MSVHLVRLKLVTTAAAAALAIAACGGTATTSGPGGPAATTAGGATAPGSGTQAPAGGSTAQPGGGGQTVDACGFLTADDIKAVTGYDVARTAPGAQVGIFQNGCEWELVAPKEMVPPSIVLGIMTTGGRDYYAKYMKPYNDEQGNTPVAVGDEAVDAGFGVIMGVKGDAFFNLQYLGRDDHELELAKKLVAHLP